MSTLQVVMHPLCITLLKTLRNTKEYTTVLGIIAITMYTFHNIYNIPIYYMYIHVLLSYSLSVWNSYLLRLDAIRHSENRRYSRLSFSNSGWGSSFSSVSGSGWNLREKGKRRKSMKWFSSCFSVDGTIFNLYGGKPSCPGLYFMQRKPSFLKWRRAQRMK